MNFVKRFIPEPKVRSAVGLDIGAVSCKLLAAARQTDGWVITHYDCQMYGDRAFAEVIREVMGRCPELCRPPVIGMSGKGTVIRFLDLPRMPADDLQKSFRYEADKYLPFDIDDIYLDTHILDPKAKTKKMRVMAAAVKKEAADKRLTLLQEAGVQADCLTLNSVALANAAACLPPTVEDKTPAIFAVFDIGQRVSALNIFQDGQLKFTREMFTAGQQVTLEIARAKQISLEEAEKVKASGSAQDIHDLAEGVMNQIISDVRLSLDYYVTEANAPVEAVFLTGGGSLLPEADRFLQEALDTPVALWDPFAGMSLQEGLDQKEWQQNRVLFTTALGLALS
ncbi:MAG: type IV pilus assembly protein PilM [Candidatus Omnitrophota bacterium]